MKTHEIESREATAQRLYTGQLAHMFALGIAETTCRIVVDVAGDILVAAHRFDGLQWSVLSSGDHQHLARSLFDEDNVSGNPQGWGLQKVAALPAWAGPATTADAMNGEVPKPLLDIAQRGGLEVDGGAILYSAQHGDQVLDHWLSYVDGGLRVNLRLLKQDGAEMEPALESPLSDPFSFEQARSMILDWCTYRELAFKHRERVAYDARVRALYDEPAR